MITKNDFDTNIWDNKNSLLYGVLSNIEPKIWKNIVLITKALDWSLCVQVFKEYLGSPWKNVFLQLLP